MKLPDDIPLGKSGGYPETYTPEVLFPIAREVGRSPLGDLSGMQGYDRWTGFELSWLNDSGKPQVAILEVDFDAECPNIIESKSFKLYLNSFNQTIISKEVLQYTLTRDLGEASGRPVIVRLYSPEHYDVHEPPEYSCLDDLDVTCKDYDINSSLIKQRSTEFVSEKLKTHLFRSLCPVTAQPDWASVYIHYEGKAIEHEGLLAYLVSYRKHQGFHEQCVESIYKDLMSVCSPKKLMVFARFMRRGGLDINPVRANFKTSPQKPYRTARQ